MTVISRPIQVDVLMPPADEPGEPPMAIRMMVTKREHSVVVARSKTLKPAVREALEWKKAQVNLSTIGIPRRAWLHSRPRKMRPPRVTRTTVAQRTTLVLSERRPRVLRLRRQNLMVMRLKRTRNPTPPEMTKKLTVLRYH